MNWRRRQTWDRCWILAKTRRRGQDSHSASFVLLVSHNCVFDASLVPGTCLERFLDLKGLNNKFLERVALPEIKWESGRQTHKWHLMVWSRGVARWFRWSLSVADPFRPSRGKHDGL